MVSTSKLIEDQIHEYLPNYFTPDIMCAGDVLYCSNIFSNLYPRSATFLIQDMSLVEGGLAEVTQVGP